ncbi:MAG: diaminopimelate epimerase [Bdellovibrionales bacterium]|nr:diaminopimelate epimerase [Bdellovibrionales bacterium]
MRTLDTPLVKLSATGNDFILVDLLQHNWSAAGERSQWVQSWCDRHEGIGADGAVFLEKHPSLDFAWDFYNSDGSPAEMCGNAARAVSLYVSTRTGKKDLAFQTRSGTVHARVESAQNIEVTLAPVVEAEWNQWSANEVDKLSFDFVRAGVPHAVLRVPDITDLERLEALALEIKRDPRFQKEGTNVTFVRPLSGSVIESVTFERGVEGFTRACGTGAVAAAHSVLRGEENKRIEVAVPGGRLFVIWKNGRPALSGPAKVIAVITWFTGG